MANRAGMFLGIVIGVAAGAEVLRASRSGELAELLLDGGSWLTLSLLSAVLLVVAVGAPHVSRPVGVCLAVAFAYAAIDPSAPDPHSTLLPLFGLAAVAGICALASHLTLSRVPAVGGLAGSSRELRAAIRAHERRSAAH